MVDGYLLPDLILSKGTKVRAFGLLEAADDGSATLWVSTPMQPARPKRLHGGALSVTILNGTSEVPLPTHRNVVVEGTWDDGGIVDAHWNHSDSPPLALVTAPKGSRPLTAITPDEFIAVETEVEVRSRDILVTGGGSLTQNYVQILHVTPSFAALYEELRGRRYPLDVYVSVVPLQAI